MKSRVFGALTKQHVPRCILRGEEDRPQEGAIGVHFANGPLIGDGQLDASRPENVSCGNYTAEEVASASAGASRDAIRRYS